jgi:hypothetical protein
LLALRKEGATGDAPALPAHHLPALATPQGDDFPAFPSHQGYGREMKLIDKLLGLDIPPVAPPTEQPVTSKTERTNRECL